MKKMLVVLLILAVAGGVFAVDLGDGFQITGEVKTGLGVFTQDDGNDDNGSDTYGTGYNDDAGHNFRTRLNAIYSNDIGGAMVRLQAEDSTDVTMAKAFGWVNLLSKKIIIWGGRGVDDIYGVGGIVDDNVDGGDLARLEFRLLDGLSFAVGIPLTFDDHRKSLANTFASLMFGAKYSSDFFVVIASARLNPGLNGMRNTVWNPADGSHSEVAEDEDIFVDAVYAVKFPALGPIGLDITGAFWSGEAGYFRVAPRVSFVAGPLDLYVQADINADLSDDTHTPGESKDGGLSNFGEREADDASIGVRAKVGYQLTDIVGLYAQVGSDNISYFEGNGLYIRPGLTFAFGPNTNIEVFDKVNKIGADGDKNAKWNIKNQLGIDFNWSF